MSSRGKPDPYIVLRVARQASGEEIARAYRRAARGSHPDRAGTGSAERFQAVTDAYEVLRDPRRRTAYDRSHPIARPRMTDARPRSVRYTAPGSQHLMLGQPPPSEPVHIQLFDGHIDEVGPLRERRDIEDLLRLALSLLRTRW
jgi:curved DNA-binding protein CbpA